MGSESLVWDSHHVQSWLAGKHFKARGRPQIREDKKNTKLGNN